MTILAHTKHVDFFDQAQVTVLQGFAADLLAAVSAAGIESAKVSAGIEKNLAISTRESKLEDLEQSVLHYLTLTAYDAGRSAYVELSQFTQNTIPHVVERIKNLLKYAEVDPFSGLPARDHLAFTFPAVQLYDLKVPTVPTIIDTLIECEKGMQAYDKRIIQPAASYHASERYVFLMNTLGFSAAFSETTHSISATCIAKQDNDMQSAHDYLVSRKQSEAFNVSQLAFIVAGDAVAKLGAKTMKTGRLPVVFAPQMAKSFVGHLARAITGAKIYRDNSFLVGARGEQVLPKSCQLYQQPHEDWMMGSRPFDSEGVSTKAQHYVENGILSHYALSTYSAKKLKSTTTGNAGGFYNLCCEDLLGPLTQADLLSDIPEGLLVTDLMGQGANLTTGDYSRGAAGFLIKAGERVRPVCNITLSGNLKTMLHHIRISQDVDRRSGTQVGSLMIPDVMVAGN